MKYYYIIYALVGTIILSCGVQSSPDSKQFTLPEKISVDIPKVLEEEKDVTTTKQGKIIVDNISIDNSSYAEIQSYVTLYKEILAEIKSDLLLADQVINEILEICKDKALNESCLIPENTLSITVDEEIFTQLRLLVPEHIDFAGDSNALLQQKLFFGLIEFIRHENNETYQYTLTMDMSQINGTLQFYDTSQLPKIIQSTKWSEDKKDIFSSITKEDKLQQNEPWTLHYHESDTEESMHINNKSVVLGQVKNNILNLKKLQDSEKDTIEFHQIKQKTPLSPLILTQNSSYLELNQSIGLQKVIETERLNAKQVLTHTEEVLDANGTPLAISYCASNTPECELYNTDTWFTDTKDETLFTPFKQIVFKALEITQGNLQEGEYWLLPLGHNIQNLSIQEALSLRVGEFIYFGTFYQGALYDKTYEEKLDTVQLIYLEYNNNLEKFSYEKSNKLFTLISNEDRPNITLKENN